MVVDSITELIGNTPLLRVPAAVHGLRHIELYAKLELFNPFGSLKDRAAWGMLQERLPELQRNGGSIMESSSGNTAKAMQGIAALYGVPFKVVTNRVRVQETRAVLQLMGAAVEELPGRSDCHDPNDPHDPLRYIDQQKQLLGDTLFVPNQYFNPKNVDAHYRTTGEEIVRELGPVDVLVGTLGTSGSTRGTGERLREANSECKVFGIAATKEDFIPGIRHEEELWEVGLFQREFYDDVAYVNSLDALSGMETLIRRLGLLAGPTSGASYQGALSVLRALDVERAGPPLKAVFIVCDRVEWYLSYIRERRPDLFGAVPKTKSIRERCSEAAERARTMNGAAATERIRSGTVLPIDIRSALAFKASRIPGSINIPEEKLTTLLESGMPFSAGMQLLFVCPVGRESRGIAGYVAAAGIDSFSLEGGIVGWRDAGFELSRG